MARNYTDVLNGSFGEGDVPPVRGLSYIFGGGVRLADDINEQSERRIAVYPCIAPAEDSEAAQGLMCALSWTLNTLDGATAMPVLIREPVVDWSAADSAFGTDDLSLEGLGEDTIVSGRLSKDDVRYTLTLTATSDVDDSEDLVVRIEGADERELLNGILEAAGTFASWLGGSPSDIGGIATVQGERAIVRRWLVEAFAWHRTCLAHAADDGEFGLGSSEFGRLTIDSAQVELTGLTVRGIALMLTWFRSVDAVMLVEVVRAMPYWQVAAGALSRALVELRQTRLAIDTLEAAIGEAPQIALNWLVLSRLYTAVQQSKRAIEALQDGITANPTYAPLLMQYGDQLVAMGDEGRNLDEVVFLEEDREPIFAFEAIEAYREAVKLLHDEAQYIAYVRLITTLVRFDPAHVWPVFESLANQDSAGTFSDLALSAVAAQDDIENAVEPLETAARKFAEVGRVWRNLAYAQYMSGNGDAAAQAIATALSFAEDAKARGEYELLALYAQDRTVEAQLAEIADIVSARGEVSNSALEFLEWVVGEAPHYTEGYLLLGRAYVGTGEADTALEVLLDAEQNLGIDPDILAAITDLLLESGEETVALDYVSKGLDAFPRHIPLLARAALVTHLLGDEESATMFLRQAHNITPYHREIMAVTARISEDSQP